MDSEPFLSLIERFLQDQSDAEVFCTEFIELWIRNRDEMYARKRTWAEPYDEQLIEAFQHGEMTADEFSERFARLWGYADSIPLQNMIDTIHSSCDMFRSLPEGDWEIDESTLRREVADALEKYRREAETGDRN